MYHKLHKRPTRQPLHLFLLHRCWQERENSTSASDWRTTGFSHRPARESPPLRSSSTSFLYASTCQQQQPWPGTGARAAAAATATQGGASSSTGRARARDHQQRPRKAARATTCYKVRARRSDGRKANSAQRPDYPVGALVRRRDPS